MLDSKTPIDSASTRRAAAEAWLKSANWNLAVMRGTRKLPAVPGEEDAPSVVRTSMRVFTHGCPPALMRDVVYLLGVNGTWRDPKIDGVVVPGVWKHKYAFWNRDSGLAENGDATKTLIRDMDDGESSTYAAVEDGCGNRTSVRYVFDATEVEPLTGIDHAGEQGYSVRIGGLSRDKESDTFSYFVTVTERKTQYLTEHQTGEDAFSEDYAADWLGLRGTVEDPSDDAGDGVTVWDPAVQAAGTVASVQWNKNIEDCTLNAQGRKRVAKADVDAGRSCSRDLYSEQDSESVSGAAAPLGHAPAPSGGVSYDYRSKLRPDLLYDTDKVAKKELAVTGSRLVTSIDVFGTETSQTDRGVTVAPAAPSAGAGVSGSLSLEKTPGDRLVATVSLKTETYVPEATLSEERTVFSRKVRRGAKSSPESKPAATAAGGLGLSASEVLTPGGRKDISREEDEELFVGAAQVADQETVFETVRRSTDVHSLADVPVAAYADGVGTEVSYDVQPLGSKNITVVTKTEKDVPQASRTTSKTIFESEISEEQITAIPATDVPEPIDGLIVTKSDSLTPLGKHRRRTTEKQELHVPNAEYTVDRAPLVVRTTAGARNSPIGEALHADEFGTSRSAKTPGDRWNTSKEVIEDVIGAVAGAAYSDNYLMKTEETDMVVSSQGPEGSVLSGRTLTEDSYSRAPGGNWIRHRRIRTCPAARMHVMTDKLTQALGYCAGHAESRTRMLLFEHSDLVTIQAEIDAFLSLYLPFNVALGSSRYYFSYNREIGYGLRPDEFATWNGSLTLHVELQNHLPNESLA